MSDSHNFPKNPNELICGRSKSLCEFGSPILSGLYHQYPKTNLILHYQNSIKLLIWLLWSSEIIQNKAVMFEKCTAILRSKSPPSSSSVRYKIPFPRHPYSHPPTSRSPGIPFWDNHLGHPPPHIPHIPGHLGVSHVQLQLHGWSMLIIFLGYQKIIWRDCGEIYMAIFCYNGYILWDIVDIYGYLMAINGYIYGILISSMWGKNCWIYLWRISPAPARWLGRIS